MTMHTTEHLPPPKSNLAAVLYGLLTQNEISEAEFRQNGFRSRISDLRRMGIPVKSKEKTGRNQFGHTTKFKVRYLFSISVPKARRTYLKINQA